jgi:hypothetical protein
MSDAKNEQHTPPPPIPEPAPPENLNDVLTRTFLDVLEKNGLWVLPVICPVCKHDVWEVAFASDMVQRYNPGKVFTFIPVRCTTCTHTIFFNAVALGLFNPDGTPSLEGLGLYPAGVGEADPPAPEPGS